jgi:hypothetical protein
MCFVLYVGTTNPLPQKKWQKDTPGPSVEPLTERDGPIKAHFSNPEVHYIGSTSGCGCAFPHSTLQNGGWPEIGYIAERAEISERVVSDRHNREALVDFLRKTGDRVVELYGVWDGDFSEVPESQESIMVEEILDSNFLFKERGFYKVTVENTNSVRN